MIGAPGAPWAGHMGKRPPLTESVADILLGGASGDVALAWFGEGGLQTLTYGELQVDVARLAGQLGGAGGSQIDLVAIVLANGPEAAIALLAVAFCAVAAPPESCVAQRRTRVLPERSEGAHVDC